MFPVRALVALALTSVILVPTARADGENRLKLNAIQHRLLSGQADLMLNHSDEQGDAAVAASSRGGGGGGAGGSFYFPSEDDLCPQSLGPDVKVNQDCQNLTDVKFAGRGQAQNETSIAYDPNNPQHLVATFNDYRRGDGNCGGAFSLDGGQTWADIVVPMSFTDGLPFGFARQYWEAGGDTSVAWDTKGNAYFSCQVFNRGRPVTQNPDQSSAMLMFRSTQNEGGSWNFPGRYVTLANDVAGKGDILEDKQLLTVDNHPGSPFQDRVYVTWTEFAPDGSAYIWGAYSADYGEHFSDRKLVSGTSPLCTMTFGVPTVNGTCNENQFSQPFTAPDGTLYVVFANYNNPTALAPRGDAGDEGAPGAGTPAPSPNAPLACAPNCENRNQVLLAKSADGGNTFSAPVKVADFYELPDCPTYQGKNPGRSCVPEKAPTTNSSFRATNYPSGAVNPTNASQVIVTIGSYINKYSNEARPNPCIPAGINPKNGNNRYVGVKTPGACNNKILLSVSNNAGGSFSGTTTDPRELTTVNQASRQIGTDQWFQWAAFAPNGKLAVSYYDRQYGNDETTGFSDFSLSGSSDLAHFGTARATTASSPPPSDFGGSFWGDYTGLTAPGVAYPIWSDTRNPELVLCPGTGTSGSPPKTCTTSASNANPANDEDVFTRAMPIPGDGEDGGGD